MIDKTVAPGAACPGGVLEFTITVTNHGAVDAQDVVVVDTLPDVLDIISATSTRGEVAVRGRAITVTIGSVAPGEVIVIRIRAQVAQEALPARSRNTAALSTSSASDDPANNSASVDFDVASCPAPAPPLVPPELPNTGAGDQNPGVPPLLWLALLAVIVGALIRRRSVGDAARINAPQFGCEQEMKDVAD